MRDRTDASAHEDDAHAAGKVGAQTLTGRLAVQRKAAAPSASSTVGATATAAPADDPFGLHLIAAQGIAGAGGALPHVDAIQRSFGPGHDVSPIRAHTDGAARQATAEMGAAGYATGNDVAFAGSPDLHLAAHEAAHVVQQRAGVQLAGGVGEVGDIYERNADQVADRVVAGQSAADLLPPAQGAGGAPIQHKPAAPDLDQEDDEDEAADGEQALEADESDEESPANTALAEGKPPGAVQQKASAPRPSAHASRAKKLTIGQATRRYAPLVFLAKGEENGPTDASDYIKDSKLRWSHDSGRDDHDIADRGEIDEDRLGDGGYEHQVEGRITGHHGDDIPSDAHVRPKDGEGDGGNEGFFLEPKHAKRKTDGANNAPVYHEAVNHRYITYWFFYAYNHGPTPVVQDNHEGDWERIVVKLDHRNRATHVAFYQHDGPPHTLRWSEVRKDGGHPVVYSAKGSHASYDTPGKKPLDFKGHGTPVKDTASRGDKWKTWQNLKSAKAQGWYGYGGAWGEVGNGKGTTGPQGPSRHKPPAPKGW